MTARIGGRAQVRFRPVADLQRVMDKGVMDGFPFFPIAAVAVFIHVVTGFLAITVEAIWNGGGWMRSGWSGLSGTIRLFTVQRREVRFQASWWLILLARATLIVIPVAVVFGLLTHQPEVR